MKQTDSPEMDLTVSYDNRCIRNYRRDTDLYVDMGEFVPSSALCVGIFSIGQTFQLFQTIN